ncbi:hypothetical protein [Puniceicoccus vermicola]|uniref:Uncharacterized protein n=1 Tax=Puniceicoccus vermicola TaxID=388746 RepID=A0A7X1B2G8_9BACT|nr:hypothetical protein [Puniceicoccus vermicola]MBC2603210.1 hypothetical protein [Puniceicoccus vermicola]
MKFPYFSVVVFCVLSQFSLLGKEIVLRDPIGTEWSGALIGEPITFASGEVASGDPQIRVLGPDQKPILSQVSDVQKHPDGSLASGKVWFMADVPADGEARYQVVPGEPFSGKEGSQVSVERGEGEATLWTAGKAHGGVRILLGEKTYAEPIEMSGNEAPIRSLILPSGKSVGASGIHAPARLKSWRSEIVEEGPLFIRARLAYQFEVDPGYWTMEITVSADTPMMEVWEKFHTGESEASFRDFDRFFTLALEGENYQPTQGWFTGTPRNPAYADLLKRSAPPAWVETGALPKQANWLGSPVNGYTLSNQPDLTEYGLTGWPTNIPNVGTFYQVVQPGGIAIGFAGINPMSWKDPIALRMGTNAQGQMEVRLALQKFTQDWNTDGFGGGSPNYTGVTEGVPQGTSWRCYGILITEAVEDKENQLDALMTAAVTLSGDSLDKIRHWVFEWPDPLTPDQLGTQSSPEAETALTTMRQRRDLHQLAGPYATFSMANHSGFAKRVFPLLEPVVKDPSLTTPEERAELRRLFAYEAYRQNSGASFPYGAGFHLNNPNMTIMAVESQARSVGLVPGHPAVPEWQKAQLALMEGFFRRFTFPNGVPFENPHYILDVTLDWAAIANSALMEANIGDAFDDPLFKKTIEFLPNWLTPPDARFLGHRVVLPLGNGSYQSVSPSFIKQYVEYYKTRDPELAEEIQWFGNATLPENKQVKIMPKETPPDLKSTWWKDYGVAFRHGFGTEYETLMFLLAGKALGHHEIESDQMAYTLYAKGQPIHLHFGNGYFPIFNRPWLRNRISFDRKMEAFERDRIEVEWASFQPAADYFRAVREVDLLKERGAEYPKLNEKGRWTDEEKADNRHYATSEGELIPLTVWTRQMAFLKDQDPAGPNYFVLRDSFGGEPTKPTDLNLWFLANGMEKESNYLHFDGQVNVDMDVFINTPEDPEITTDRYGHVQQPYNRLVGFDPQYHPGGKLGEYQELLRISQGPGEDYMVVLYPRLKGKDPAAKFTRLDPETVRVETELSTDVVFLGTEPREISGEDWRFTGGAFAIRFYRDGRLALVNFEGACAGKLGEQDIAGEGAFTVTLQDGQATVTELGEDARVELQ